jgi:predicted DNA-binding transcriptional regulator AlpA
MQVMALAEVADYLGVSRQRAAVLVDRPDFPAPLDTLSVGRIWSASDVRTYAERRRRRLDDEGADK